MKIATHQFFHFSSLGTENIRAEVGNANEHTKANKEKINA